MRFKYVIFHWAPSESMLQVLPVVFPEHVTHSMIRMEDPSHPGLFLKPYSAGFFYLEDDDVPF